MQKNTKKKEEKFYFNVVAHETEKWNKEKFPHFKNVRW
jgi:hypothetical protein